MGPFIPMVVTLFITLHSAKIWLLFLKSPLNLLDMQGKKVKVHTFDIAPLRSESPPQKRSGMARVLKGFHSFTCTPIRSFAIGMSHTCLCQYLPLPSHNWYSFTDPGGMEDVGAKYSPGRDSNLQPPNCKSGTLPQPLTSARCHVT